MCVSRTVYASEYKIFTKRSGKRIRDDEEWEEGNGKGGGTRG